MQWIHLLIYRVLFESYHSTIKKPGCNKRLDAPNFITDASVGQCLIGTMRNDTLCNGLFVNEKEVLRKMTTDFPSSIDIQISDEAARITLNKY